MAKDVIFIEGFVGPKGRRHARKLAKKIEQEIEKRITIIEYIEHVESFLGIKKFQKSKSIIEYSEIIHKRIKELEIKEFVLIGYSAGAIIARYLVEKMELEAKIILIAAPNKGIRLYWWERLFFKAIGGTPLCVKDILPNSRLLQHLGPLNPDYYCLAGSSDKRVSIESSLPLSNSHERSFLIKASHKKLVIKAVPIITKII